MAETGIAVRGSVGLYFGADGRPRGVDGEKLLATAIRFSRALRAEGLSSDLGAVVDFARALSLVEIGDREEVHAAGAALFVRHREQRETYDRVFRRFWRARGGGGGPTIEPPTTLVDEREQNRPRPKRDEERMPAPPDRGEGGSAEGAESGRERESNDADEFEAIVVSARAYSSDTVDRHRQFDRMTADEIREAERLVDMLTPKLELRRTRRHEIHRRGRVVAARTMLRRNVKTGGDTFEWLWQRPVRRPRQLVVLCDVSGSMERHSRLLLRFAQALATSAVRTEAFVFGTRLTRVTRLLRGRDRDAALARVAEATTDWSGGTRIGDSLHEFNRRWSRRVMRSSAVVVIVSDGWDLGDPAVVAAEMARLRRSAHRVIWLNPLASAPGYQPLATGMAAALPHVDDFVPAGTLASLERLAILLADTASRRTTRRSAPADGGATTGQSITVEARR